MDSCHLITSENETPSFLPDFGKCSVFSIYLPMPLLSEIGPNVFAVCIRESGRQENEVWEGKDSRGKIDVF